MRKLEQSIRMQQKNTSFIIPHISFGRVVREALADLGDYSIRSQAMAALQCAAEEHLTDVFFDAGRLAAYQKRDTVLPSDFRFFTEKRQYEEDAVEPTVFVADSEGDTSLPLTEPVQ